MLVRDTLLKIPATEQGNVGVVARVVVDVLAAGGWLHDPVEVEHLRTVAHAARSVAGYAHSADRHRPLIAALRGLDTAGPIDLGDDPDGDMDGADYPPFGSVPVTPTPPYRGPFGDAYGEPSERPE